MVYFKNILNLATKLPFPFRTKAMENWFKDSTKKKSDASLFFKTLRRIFFLFVSGQYRWHRDSIDKKVKRILWLHITSHTGDSLMRLSAAQLLAENFSVDLCATKPATDVFLAGHPFSRIFSLENNRSLVDKQDYSLILLDDLKAKSLKFKKRLFPKVPFVTLHEYFDYCRDDYNFILFSWYRMAYLLRHVKTYKNIESQANLAMNLSAQAERVAMKLPIRDNAIAIAVGGREKQRTYQQWGSVIEMIRKYFSYQQIVLVGAENGSKMCQEIFEKLDRKNIIDCVGKYSLMETAAIISCCEVFVGADGGLLHVANAVSTPFIGLFADVLPEYRCTGSTNKFVLFATEDVNRIEPKEVVKCILEWRQENKNGEKENVVKQNQ